MAHWKRKINIRETLNGMHEGSICIPDGANDIAQKLKALPEHETDCELQVIIDALKTVEDDQEFDNILERLYDWGDIILDETWPTTRQCWIGVI